MIMLTVAVVLAVLIPIMLAIQGRSQKPPQLTEDEKRRAAELQKAAVHEAALRAWKPQ
jgi:hypothetical protein